MESKSMREKSIIPYSEDHPFPLENIPFGCFQNANTPDEVKCCTRIGDFVLDIALLER